MINSQLHEGMSISMTTLFDHIFPTLRALRHEYTDNVPNISPTPPPSPPKKGWLQFVRSVLIPSAVSLTSMQFAALSIAFMFHSFFWLAVFAAKKPPYPAQFANMFISMLFVAVFGAGLLWKWELQTRGLESSTSRALRGELNELVKRYQLPKELPVTIEKLLRRRKLAILNEDENEGEEGEDSEEFNISGPNSDVIRWWMPSLLLSHQDSSQTTSENGEKGKNSMLAIFTAICSAQIYIFSLVATASIPYEGIGSAIIVSVLLSIAFFIGLLFIMAVVKGVRIFKLMVANPRIELLQSPRKLYYFITDNSIVCYDDSCNGSECYVVSLSELKKWVRGHNQNSVSITTSPTPHVYVSIDQGEGEGEGEADGKAWSVFLHLDSAGDGYKAVICVIHGLSSGGEAEKAASKLARYLL